MNESIIVVNKDKWKDLDLDVFINNLSSFHKYMIKRFVPYIGSNSYVNTKLVRKLDNGANSDNYILNLEIKKVKGTKTIIMNYQLDGYFNDEKI